MPRRKRRGVPNLGERIKGFMAASNLDASELSARTGISVSYLSRILGGAVVNPTIDFLSRIAAGLGVTETQLLREDVDGQVVGQGQQEISPPLPSIVHPAMRLSSVRLGAKAQEIARLVASAGLEEEVERRVFAEVLEFTKRTLSLVEVLRKTRKEP